MSEKSKQVKILFTSVWKEIKKMTRLGSNFNEIENIQKECFFFQSSKSWTRLLDHNQQPQMWFHCRSSCHAKPMQLEDITV